MKPPRSDAVELHLSADEMEDVRRRADEAVRHSQWPRNYEHHGDDLRKRTLEGFAAHHALANWRGGLPPDTHTRYRRVPRWALALDRSEANADPRCRWVLIVGRDTPSGEWTGWAVGWCWSNEAPTLGTWREDRPHPAWFIEQDDLHSMRKFGLF